MTEETPKEAAAEAPTTETQQQTESAEAGGHPATGTPRAIGRFHIRHLIDSGGMGKVYLAVQEQPRRTVALKVMRQGIASRSALRRFEFESQILARLKHPCIAEVYEAGTHDDGSGGVPYFAMEYIPNAKTITEYAQSKSLSHHDRLELFARVCEAVHHGHQKGIIHRDLKPSNILIDSDGNPKIIDFGVARSTDSDMAITTLQTDIGQLIGTLQYMSPEQCDADPHDIDIRSDVYALGVVLYELLCNQLPYDVSKLAIHEAVRVIQEQLPTRPSTIIRTLRDDVETITLKAMEKDRQRRYRSAIDLSDDIHRYLNDEPIEARSPTAMYLFQRFVTRNKTLVGGVAAVFVVLVVGIIATSLALTRAISAEHLANLETSKAKAEAAKSQQIAGFIQGMLSSADPWALESAADLGRELSVVDLLDDATTRLDTAFVDHPEVEASIRKTLGSTYYGLGLWDKAEAHLTRALEARRRILGNEHSDTLEAMDQLGQLRMAQEQLEEAEALYTHTLDTRIRLLGRDHPETADSLFGLSMVYVAQLRDGEAEPLCREAWEIRQRHLGPDHPDTLLVMGGLAHIYRNLGRLDHAESLLLQSLAARRRVLGEEHMRTLTAQVNLSSLYRDQGRYDEAEPLLAEAVEKQNRILGQDNPNALISTGNLGYLYTLQGAPEKGKPLLEGVVERSKRTLPEGHWIRVVFLGAYGICLARLEQYEDAEAALLESHRDLQPVYGAHEYTRDVVQGLADLYDAWGKPEQAAAWRAKLPATPD